MHALPTQKLKLLPFHFSEICLKLLTDEMLKETLSWRNTYKEWFNDNNEITMDKHINWYQHYLQLNNDFIFIVFDRQENRLGQTSIYNIDWEKKIGEFGRIVVNPEFSGQGYMREACLATVQLATQILALNKLILSVKASNHRAIRIYEDCGFVFANDHDHCNNPIDNITMMWG